MYICCNCQASMDRNMPAQLCTDCFQKAYKYANCGHLLEYVEPIDRDGEPTGHYITVDPPVLLTDEEYAFALPTWDEEVRACEIAHIRSLPEYL